MEKSCCRDCALQMPLTRYGTCWECHANEFASLRASNERMRGAFERIVNLEQNTHHAMRYDMAQTLARAALNPPEVPHAN